MVEQKAVEPSQEKLSCAGLPLAVYREVAAHLRQVQGVETKLVEQQSSQFNYHHSQIDHLWLQYPANLTSYEKQRLEEILAYYALAHGIWQREQVS